MNLAASLEPLLIASRRAAAAAWEMLVLMLFVTGLPLCTVKEPELF